MGDVLTNFVQDFQSDRPQTGSSGDGSSTPVGRIISVNGARIQGLQYDTIGNNGAAVPAAPLRIGAILKVATPAAAVFGVVGNISISDPSVSASEATRVFDLELLGEIPHGAADGPAASFQRGVSIYPVLDDEIFIATSDERARIYAQPEKSHVRVGTLHPDNDLPAYLSTDDMLGKHFAILGSTGSGKSCSVALILRAILADHPNGHVVLLDPHNEYSQAFGANADVLSPDQLLMPYWILNFEEMVEVAIGRSRRDVEAQMAILKDGIVAAKKKFAGEKAATEHITVDTPVPYVLSELIAHINGQMGQFENPESSAPFLRLKARLESLRSDRRYAFMFSGLVVQDILPDILSRILSIPVANKPVTILDLSGVPSEIVDVVVSVLCRMIFDFALWSVPHRHCQCFWSVKKRIVTCPAIPTGDLRRPRKQFRGSPWKAGNTAFHFALFPSAPRSCHPIFCLSATPCSRCG